MNNKYTEQFREDARNRVRTKSEDETVLSIANTLKIPYSTLRQWCGLMYPKPNNENINNENVVNDGEDTKYKIRPISPITTRSKTPGLNNNNKTTMTRNKRSATPGPLTRSKTPNKRKRSKSVSETIFGRAKRNNKKSSGRRSRTPYKRPKSTPVVIPERSIDSPMTLRSKTPTAPVTRSRTSLDNTSIVLKCTYRNSKKTNKINSKIVPLGPIYRCNGQIRPPTPPKYNSVPRTPNNTKNVVGKVGKCTITNNRTGSKLRPLGDVSPPTPLHNERVSSSASSTGSEDYTYYEDSLPPSSPSRSMSINMSPCPSDLTDPVPLSDDEEDDDDDDLEVIKILGNFYYFFQIRQQC